jgi:citronellol/citronellal dehydrogenase
MGGIMTEHATEAAAPEYGFSDEELAVLPTVYRDGLFDGQVVLVSGAGSGLGKATAFLFARLGADLVICGRDPEKLETTEAALKAFGGAVLSQSMTIRDPDQVGALMDAVWDRFGRLDVLIDNAGGQFAQPAIDYSVKGWQAVIDLNLNGTWYMMQNAARHWRDRDQAGCIVNIVAVVARGLPGISHTCAARAGIIHLSKSLAIEWAPLNIRVNNVAVGCVETQAVDRYPPEARPGFKRANPMMRMGDAQDVAEACVYLAAPSGKFITGEVVAIDGGQQLWGDFWALGRPDYYGPDGGPDRQV